MRIRDHIASVLLVTVSLVGVACSHDEPRANDTAMISTSSGGTAASMPRTVSPNETSDPMGGNQTNFAPATPGTTTYNTAGAGTVSPTSGAYGTPVAPSATAPAVSDTGMGGYEATNPDPVRNPAQPIDTGVATDVTGSSGTNLGGNVAPARPAASTSSATGTATTRSTTTRHRTVTRTTNTNATH